jgi:hypothetical protein
MMPQLVSNFKDMPTLLYVHMGLCLCVCVCVCVCV